MSCEKGMLTGHKISGVRFVLLDGKSFVSLHWPCLWLILSPINITILIRAFAGVLNSVGALWLNVRLCGETYCNTVCVLYVRNQNDITVLMLWTLEGYGGAFPHIRKCPVFNFRHVASILLVVGILTFVTMTPFCSFCGQHTHSCWLLGFSTLLHPWAWNRLPTELKLLRSTTSFCRQLKTIFVPVCLQTPGNRSMIVLWCAVGLPEVGTIHNTALTVTVNSNQKSFTDRCPSPHTGTVFCNDVNMSSCWLTNFACAVYKVHIILSTPVTTRFNLLQKVPLNKVAILLYCFVFFAFLCKVPCMLSS